ncbi:MAG: DUF1640 domain-containing protein [Kiritimatiellia bacterium]|jgi:uncharacterized protein YPO0396|nr:DUF1640 domain-containing protein [Kiritimatiellia bacterium]MDP6810992.1 DUF1640 domain-containing protein [Kiritimatiellia bacterium]MDP7025209.1 DUF1640 domain-containing protein [Kiritimatiellia bacterium]
MELSIDTLDIFERLKKAHLEEDAARELSEVFRDSARQIIEQQREVLATREDLTQTKVEIIKWVAGMLVAQAAIVATLVKLL